jgi:hypothetical protein
MVGRGRSVNDQRHRRLKTVSLLYPLMRVLEVSIQAILVRVRRHDPNRDLPRRRIVPLGREAPWWPVGPGGAGQRKAGIEKLPAHRITPAKAAPRDHDRRVSRKSIESDDVPLRRDGSRVLQPHTHRGMSVPAEGHGLVPRQRGASRPDQQGQQQCQSRPDRNRPVRSTADPWDHPQSFWGLFLM